MDRIRALEALEAAAAAAQARDAADLDGSQRRVQAAAGVPAAELGRGVAAQVALARRDSLHRGGQHLGLARAFVHEMPHTLADLQGLCEACTYATEAPGWRSEVDDRAPTHTVVTTAPTGHTHRSGAPPLPGAPAMAGPAATTDPPAFAGVVERWLADQVASCC